MSFDHREAGTVEELWSATLARLPRLEASLADAVVLVVAAHPDDETLGAGGLIRDAATGGASVRVLVATDGEASHPGSPTLSSERLATVRRAEVAEAVGALSHAAKVEFLGLPDGALGEHLDQLTAAIVEQLDGCTHVLSPWRGDHHADHEAAAEAVRTAVAGRAGVRHWQYPIWAWHWAQPDSSELPWPVMRRLELTPAAVRAKQTAIGCHASQHAPLSDAAGDEPILSPGLLAHFARPFETFVVDGAVEPPAPASEPAYFDALYAASEDPWGLGERFYERRKRELLLAALPRERFDRAFEPGCATGRLTAELATRCRTVLAWDGVAAAVRQARERVASHVVTVQQRRIPYDWPDGRFDLIVLSEVGYYCPELDLLAGRVRESLTGDGVLVACHWNHPAPDHSHSAREVHDALAVDLRPIAHHFEADFLLDVWSVTGRSVADAEGILA
ncbi:MAG: PIG-L family deacetylase [Jatrophihabitantaceae bacterium]